MTWSLHFTRSALDGLQALPPVEQKRVGQLLERLRGAGPLARTLPIRQLTGQDDIWRARAGRVRVLYRPLAQAVDVVAIRWRKEAYRSPIVAAEALLTLAPDQPIALPAAPRRPARPTEAPANPPGELVATPQAPEEPSEELAADLEPEEVGAQPLGPSPDLLPQKIDEAFLAHLFIPVQYRAAFKVCRTGDQLLEAPVPSAICERVLNALFTRPLEQALAEKRYQVDSLADLDRYLAGELKEFLLALDDSQRRLVDRALKGPTMVKGGLGTGKSTVALHRARAMLEPERDGRQLDPGGRPAPSAPRRVLFCTYTNSLVGFSKELLEHLTRDLNARVEVRTLDSLVGTVLRKGGQSLELCHDDSLREAAQRAIKAFLTQCDRATPAARMQAAFVNRLSAPYLVEEIEDAIEGRGNTTLERYLAANRTSRGRALNEGQRRVVWTLYQAVTQQIEQHHRVSRAGLRRRALEVSRELPTAEKYDAVLVDEAQDLPPVALALVVEMARSPEGVFLAADANQSLYQRGFSWREAHEALSLRGKVGSLRRNYRTTRAIAAAASDLLDERASDAETLITQAVIDGPRPRLISFVDPHAALVWLAAELREQARELRLPLSACALLLPTNAQASKAAQTLAKAGTRATHISKDNLDLDRPEVKVMTIHSAKGLEFPIVAIPQLDSDILPRTLYGATPEEAAEQVRDDARLVYVAATRAMRRLTVTYSRRRPSPFVARLSDAHWERLDH